MRRRGRVVAACVLAISGLFVAGAGFVVASGPVTVTVNVDTTEDLVYATDAQAPNCPIQMCSLRRAVQFANSHTDGTLTVIDVPAGVYNLTQASNPEGSVDPKAPDDSRHGDLHILDSLVVIIGAGPGKTIIKQDPSVTDRVFAVGGTYPSIGRLRMSGVTIRDGHAGGEATNADGNEGGGIAVQQDGYVELFNAEVVDNAAIGVVSTLGAVTGGYGGGIAVDGFDASAVLHEVTIAGNTANDGGGGVALRRGSAVIYNSTINANHCLLTCRGGGILAGKDFNVSNVTVDKNSAFQGGGIAVEAKGVVFNSSTISGNTLTAALGSAAIGRAAVGREGVVSDGADLWVNSDADVTLARDIVAGSTGNECFVSPAGPDLGSLPGKITSGGSNLDQHNSCKFTAAGDQPGVDPRLGPLAANDGPTMTRAIGPGSPALDAVVASCPPPSRDQRGVQRASAAAGTGSRCDIGAYEYQGAVAATNSSIPRVIETFVPALPQAGGPPDGGRGPSAIWVFAGLALIFLAALTYPRGSPKT